MMTRFEASGRMANGTDSVIGWQRGSVNKALARLIHEASGAVAGRSV